MSVQFDKIVDNKTSADIIVDEVTGYKEVFKILNSHEVSIFHHKNAKLTEVIFYDMMKYVFSLNAGFDYLFIGKEDDTGTNAIYYYYEINKSLYCVKLYAFYNSKTKQASITFEPVTRIDNEVVFDVNNAPTLQRPISEFKLYGIDLEIKFIFGNKTKIL